jgi:hypothetical protein
MSACTLSREPYPVPNIWDPLARVFDAWGLERCLWGIDWTRAVAVVDDERAVEQFVKTDQRRERETVGRSSERVRQNARELRVSPSACRR